MADKEINIEQFDSRLAAAYSRTVNKERQYDEWAASYDDDLVGDMQYVAYRDASDIFIERAGDQTMSILDVACGTGLVAEYLNSRGYLQIDGADFSREMLAIAQKRQVYCNLWQHDFTGAKSLDRHYDALLCVGLFSFAVPEICDMHNVVNCVKPGGLCVITVNGAAWQQLGLESAVYQEAMDHGFNIEEVITAGYIEKEGIDSRVLVIRR